MSIRTRQVPRFGFGPVVYSETGGRTSPSFATVVRETPTQLLNAGLVDADDALFAPTISVVLAPGLLADSDAFFAADVSQTSPNTTLLPDVVAADDAFFAAVVSALNTIAPDIAADADESFYSPAVFSTYDLLPDIVVDGDVFFAAEIAHASPRLEPELLSDDDTFFAAAAAGLNALAVSVVDDSDAFFAAILSPGGFRPGIVADDDTIFLPTFGQGLDPDLLVDDDAFPSPSVAQNLGPSIISDNDAVFAAVLQFGSVAVLPPLLLDLDIIAIPAVQSPTRHGQGGGGSGGNVPSDIKYATKIVMDTAGLIISLEADASVTKAVNTRMMLYADVGGVPGALLARSADHASVIAGTNSYPLLVPVSVLAGTAIWVSLHSDGNFSWFLSASQGGSRFNNDLFSDGPSDPFGAASTDNKKAPVFVVSLSAENATLAPGFVDEGDTFFAPSERGRMQLAPSLVDDADGFFDGSVPTHTNLFSSTTIAADDAIFPPAVASRVELLPSLIIESDIILDPAASTQAGQVLTAAIPDDDEIFIPTVVAQGADLPASIFDDQDVLFAPILGLSSRVLPDVVADDDVIHAAAVSWSNQFAPSLLIDVDDIGLPGIMTQGGAFDLGADVLIDSDAIFAAAVHARATSSRIDLSGERGSATALQGTRDGGTSLAARRDTSVDLDD